jgi:hypothetical protein
MTKVDEEIIQELKDVYEDVEFDYAEMEKD